MSTEPQEQTDMMATQPIKEHQWLQNLIGEWRIENEMSMEPGGEKMKSTGTSSVKSLDGLWAFSENKEAMPNGQAVTSYWALGYDVTFKKYQACIIMSASSHLWKYDGTLSSSGTTMTLDCVGPAMTEEPGTALYREVIELIDKNHRTHTSYSQDEDGSWQEFAKAHYFRV